MSSGKVLEVIRKKVAKEAKRLWPLLELEGFGGTEGVHDARVALRRTRSLWRLAEGLGDERARKLRRRARALAAGLGAVRDLDVLAARLEGDLAEGGPGLKGVEAWLGRIRSERRGALAAASHVLGPKEAGRYRKKVEAWLDREPEGPTLERALPGLVEVAAAQVLDAGRPGTEAEAHRLRIAVKRLRYTLEAFREWLPEEEARIERLVRAQDLLGEAHDRTIAAFLARQEGLEAYASLLESAVPGLVEEGAALARGE